MYIYELSNKNHSQHNFPILISLFMDLNLKCGKCHKAGHYTRSCDKISHVGGNSKLPNASEAITEKRTSSTQSTVQQDCQRSEASSGVVTKTLQTTPSKWSASGKKLEFDRFYSFGYFKLTVWPLVLLEAIQTY